ncbi:acetamidase/formamidase family protein [Caldiplasma sukawensis]
MEMKWSEQFIHYSWTAKNVPCGTIKPGEKVILHVPDSSVGKIRENTTLEKFKSMNLDSFEGAFGPFSVEGAEPGDAIVLNIDSIKSGNFGWSAVIPGFGLIKDAESILIKWKKKDGYWGCVYPENFLKGIRIKDRPFLGVVGVSPATNEYGMIPPQHFGGNMDFRHMTEGFHISFPVFLKGGNISFGDSHGSQGNGEVCGTAIETDSVIEFHLEILKNSKIKTPVARGSFSESGQYLWTTGVGPDLYQCAREALFEMIREFSYLGLNNTETYVLASIVGDLEITEIVDEPNFVVSLKMPSDLL